MFKIWYRSNLFYFVLQMSSQQQYVQPSFVANSATLGQLARNLAPKPLPGSGSGMVLFVCVFFVVFYQQIV